MLRICLCLLAGAYALEVLSVLPTAPALLAAALGAAACLWVPRLRLAGCFLLGAMLVWSDMRALEAERLAPELQGQTLMIRARIADFPEYRGGSLRFPADIAEDMADDPALPRRVRLTWYDPPDRPRIGETWQLTVRLRRPRGFANPSGFDYELWLARQRIGAAGYVVADPANRRQEGVGVDRRSALRQRLVERITAVVGENDASAVLMAITVGARHHITAAQWERYGISGTSHMMAISGLHIGLAAGGAYLLGWILCAPLCRRGNLRDLAGVSAVVVACLYADVSGFAVPARRALLMTLGLILALLMRRQAPPVRVVAIVCVVVLATDPLAIHAPGFKLSFAAVAVLLWLARQRAFAADGADTSAGRRIAGGVGRLAALQICLLLGLYPLTALVFGRLPWLAPAVNLLALPLFNAITVPASLLGLALDGPCAPAGDQLLKASWHSVRLLLWLVGKAAAWPPARAEMAAASGVMLLVVLLPALWAIAPPGFPGRKLALVAAVAAWLHKPSPPPPGCFDVTALDVGQGLAVVLRTHRRTLVYDAGPSFRGGGDAAELVVAPYLRRSGVGRVDLLVVSHSDHDHAGGAGSLLEAVDVMQLLVGEYLAAVDRPQIACRNGQAWLWDGVRFAIMHPGLYPLQSNNNSSCVLEVSAGEHKLLLTGDIESPVENHLARISALSPVDIVIVPHHGSGTSSSGAFVAALKPAVAIVTAGYENRWGFPKEEVVRRWHAAGARIVNTATSGAIHYRVCPDGGAELVGEHRVRHKKYWHDPVTE